LFRLLLPLLTLAALSAPCLGQSSFIKSDVILNVPDTALVGGNFYFELPPNVPYKIEPVPKVVNIVREGKTILYCVQQLEAPGYKIIVDYRVVHPTPAERKSAPWDDRVAFDKWLETHSDDEFFQDSHTVKVGTGPKPPDPPTPPDPPVPPPGPAPIPLAGLRVMIVEEQSERHKLSAGHQSIMFGKPFRDYLNSVCTAGVKVPAKKEWRIYEKDMDVSADGEHWAKALARPKTSYPWIVISNGTSGFEGSLPSDPQAAMELINKYKVQQ
jgi:hypothetical protein